MNDKLYDRHGYIVHLKDGRMFPFEDYEFMRSWWYAHARTGLLSHVTIEDIEEPKGFG